MKKIVDLLESWGKPGLIFLFVASTDVAIVALGAAKLSRWQKTWITMVGTSIGMCIMIAVMSLGVKTVGLTTEIESLLAAFIIGLIPIPQFMGGSLPRLAALAAIVAMPAHTMIAHAFALLVGAWVRILAIVFFIEEIKNFLQWLFKNLRRK